MRVISLFTGAGGLDLGFSMAGHEIVWANDFDKYAVETYKYNIEKFSTKKHIHFGDICEILGTGNEYIDHHIPDADIVIGGFPCLGFSIANVGRSMEDERNYLYLELLRVISRKQTPFFMAENVKGLENMEKGQVINMILDDFENAGKDFGGPGYTVIYNVFNAADFGVPQNRERVIILGVRNDIVDKINLPETPLTNLFDRKRLHIPTTHSKDGTIHEKIKPHEKMNKAYAEWKLGKIENIKELFLNNNGEKYAHRTVRDAIEDLPLDHKEDSDTLYNHYGTMCKVKINGRVGNRVTEWDKVSPTIMGRGSGTGGPLIIPHPNLHRRMTIREVARIQTFPDNFIFMGSNSARYRQIGNAVPVMMAYHLGNLFNTLGYETFSKKAELVFN